MSERGRRKVSEIVRKREREGEKVREGELESKRERGREREKESTCKKSNLKRKRHLI
jgi:hypothetical protein